MSNVSSSAASTATQVTGGQNAPAGDARLELDLGQFAPADREAGRRTFAGAIRKLALALDTKDSDTWQHSSRVATLSAAMARVLGLDRAMQAELRVAGELHDVGKVGVPVELLRRPGRLSADEYREVLLHTVIGERLLRPLMRAHPHVLRAVRSHHERFAGGGFPDGLRGHAIPLAARIVAVADAFDAMTSSRPYRPALGVTAAVRELRTSTGSQFDPACVRALLVVLRAEGRVGARRACPMWRTERRRTARSSRVLASATPGWRAARRLSGPARADPGGRPSAWLARDGPTAADQSHVAAPARASPHWGRGPVRLNRHRTAPNRGPHPL